MPVGSEAAPILFRFCSLVFFREAPGVLGVYCQQLPLFLAYMLGIPLLKIIFLGGALKQNAKINTLDRIEVALIFTACSFLFPLILATFSAKPLESCYQTPGCFLHYET